MATSSPAISTPPAAPTPKLFPDAPRLVYERNPLVEVICQLRFPSVLRIDAELPVHFQDQVREVFPIYAEPAAPQLPGIPDEVVRAMGSLPAGFLVEKSPRRFLSADENWTITLTKDFLALSTKQYLRWELFRKHLELAVAALEAHYKPAFYSRVGLRYRNVIRRSALDLSGVEWPSLLRHQLAGELASPEISERVETTNRRTLVKLLFAESKVNIRHGIAVENNEPCYVIDNDLYTESRTERAHAFDILQYFCAEAHRLFRWCISDQLHQAMGPKPLE